MGLNSIQYKESQHVFLNNSLCCNDCRMAVRGVLAERKQISGTHYLSVPKVKEVQLWASRQPSCCLMLCNVIILIISYFIKKLTENLCEHSVKDRTHGHQDMCIVLFTRPDQKPVVEGPLLSLSCSLSHFSSPCTTAAHSYWDIWQCEHVHVKHWSESCVWHVWAPGFSGAG